MPLSVVQRLSLGELTPTAIMLHMADRSMAQPEGVLEDVLIKVGKFIFPVDFVIMKMEEDCRPLKPVFFLFDIFIIVLLYYFIIFLFRA